MHCRGGAAALAIAFAIWAGAAPAGGVAYLDYSQLLQEAPQAQASHTALHSEFASQLAAVRNDRKEVERLRAKLRSLGLDANPITRAGVYQQLRNAQQKLRAEKQSYNASESLRQRQLIASFKALVDKEVRAYARAHGFGIVIKRGAVYVGPGSDITAAILARLKTDYAAAQQSQKSAH